MKNYFPKRIHRVYIDATIPSNLVARLSRDPKIAEWQRITWQFWQDPRFEFILSDLIIDEISVGNANQVAARQQIVAGLTVVATGALEFEIAEHLISEKAIPQRAFTDALHVAIAATHNIPYLATWNFTHLANPHTKPKIERICRNAGHSPPRIDSPKAILTGGTLMYDNPVEDIRKAKARLVALFGDLETYKEFMLTRQEKRMKQGVKYADFCPSRQKKEVKNGKQID